MLTYFLLFFSCVPFFDFDLDIVCFVLSFSCGYYAVSSVLVSAATRLAYYISIRTLISPFLFLVWGVRFILVILCIILGFYLFSSWGNVPLQNYWSLWPRTALQRWVHVSTTTTLSGILVKLWSQASSLLPPGTVYGRNYSSCRHAILGGVRARCGQNIFAWRRPQLEENPLWGGQRLLAKVFLAHGGPQPWRLNNYCTILLRYTTVLYYCSILLYYTTVLCYCTILLYYTTLYYTTLYYTTVLYYCTILLCYTTVLYYCSILLYYTTVLYYCTILLYYTTVLYYCVLYYCTILMYYTTVLYCCRSGVVPDINHCTVVLYYCSAALVPNVNHCTVGVPLY